MAYISAIIEHIVVVRFQSGGPQPEDLDALLRVLERQRIQSGQLLRYVVVLGENVALPTVAQRKSLDAFTLRLVPLVSHSHAVIEGTGIKRAIQRSVLSVIGGLDWWKHDSMPLTFHADAEEALRTIAAEDGLNVEQVLKAAKAAGLITTPG